MIDMRRAARVVLLTAVGGCVGPLELDDESTGATTAAIASSSAGDTTPGTSSSGAGPVRPPSDGSSSSDDDGASFIETPDGGTEFECDIIEQDCPPGEKCMPWANDGGSAWNATRCFPIARDPKQHEEACTVEGNAVSGIDDCDRGLMCWEVDREGHGHCAAFCSGSARNPTCPSPAYECSISGELALCIALCDPLAQDCPQRGEVCYPVNESWKCVVDSSGDQGAYGDPCEFTNACDTGHVCAGAAAFTDCAGPVGCCTTVCDVTDDDADATCAALDPGQSCEAWYVEGMAPPGYENVGVCALPG